MKWTVIRLAQWAGIAFLFTFLFCIRANAATYYVDYDSGDDSRPGTSEAAAWQHAPGDPNATGFADATVPIPGDEVRFHGGVRYQGCITIPSDGDSTMPITYTGNAWGPDRAIIDGGTEFGGAWTQCASAQDCGGNPDYLHIYYTAVSGITSFRSGFFEDNEWVWAAQDPDPPDRFHYDRINGLRMIPFDDPTVFHSRTAITDPRYLSAADPNAYNGAYVLVWGIPPM